jgi:hypothetical protein
VLRKYAFLKLWEGASQIGFPQIAKVVGLGNRLSQKMSSPSTPQESSAPSSLAVLSVDDYILVRGVEDLPPHRVAVMAAADKGPGTICDAAEGLERLSLRVLNSVILSLAPLPKKTKGRSRNPNILCVRYIVTPSNRRVI